MRQVDHQLFLAVLADWAATAESAFIFLDSRGAGFLLDYLALGVELRVGNCGDIVLTIDALANNLR